MGASVWAPGSQVINVDAESTFLGQTFSVSAGQTVLTLSAFTYVVETGSICVFRGGQKLVKDVDYEETDATHVTLLITDLAEGETVEVVAIIGTTGANSVAAAASALEAETAKEAAEAAAASVGFTISSVTELSNKTLKAAASNTVEATSGPDGSQLAGFRNKIINGAFNIWQRATAQSVAGYGSADRWALYTDSHICGMGVIPDIPRGGLYFVRTTTSGGNAASIYQRIENLKQFSNTRVTISFAAKMESGASKTFAVGLTKNYGTGGSPSSSEALTPQSFTVTNARSKFKFSFDVGGVNGTYGTNNDSYLELSIQFPASQGNIPYGAAFIIYDIQLEEGSIATPFEHRPIGLELSLCQRYYEICQVSFAGNVTTSTTYNAAVTYKATKRATPIVSSLAQFGQLNGSFNTRSAGGITEYGCTWGGITSATISAAGFIDSIGVSAEL